MTKTNDMLLRVMVDANVLIAGIGWVRFPYEILQHAVKGDFQLVLCPLLLEEARKYILRIVPDKLPNFEAFLNDSEYELVTNPTSEEIEANLELVRDPKDIYLALAAINAEVDFLITQDRDFTDQDETTRELHQKLKIILPGTFLREHMDWTSEQLEGIRNRTWKDLED